MTQDIDALYRTLNDEQRRVLAVLASERGLTLSAIERLGLSADTQRWLVGAVGQGCVVDRGIVYGMPLTRSTTGERAYGVEARQRSALLRRVADAGELERAASDGRTIAGEYSIAGFSTALYAGNIRALERETQSMLRRSLRGEEAPLLRELLRAAVGESLDGNWLFRTWGKDARRLIEQVLSDALATLEPIEPLYAFLATRLAGSASVRSDQPNVAGAAKEGASSGDDWLSERIRVAMVEHAWLRGDRQTLTQGLAHLPTAWRLLLDGVPQVFEGQLGSMQAILNGILLQKSTERLQLAWPVSFVIVMAIVAMTREPDEGAALTKRLLRQLSNPEPPAIADWPTTDFETRVAKALRVLLRRLTTPDREHSRISPHQQSQDSPAWESLIQALTVQVQEGDSVTRLGWAKRMLADAERWQAAAYAWMARQARQLADALSPKDAQEWRRNAETAANEFVLAGLLEREPEHRRALRALEHFAESIEAKDRVVSRRVAWYLDMTYGELAKPALDEYRPDVGWTRGRRVDLDELRKLRDTLPTEDVAVLAAIDAAPRCSRMPPEAVEALCGHPRVFNGNRGRQPVEVVHGHCRIETSEERGSLVIRTEPTVVEVGLHVVVENETRVVVYRIDSVFAKLNAVLQDGLRLPPNQKQDGLALLARLAPHLEIRSPELGAFRAIRADSAPCLRISSDAGAFWVEVGVRPFGELGRFFPPGVGRTSVTVHGGDDLFESERDLAEENARFRSLLSACPTLDAALKHEADVTGSEEPRYSATLGEEDLFAVLTELQTHWPNCPIEWKNCRSMTARGKLTAASLQGSLRRTKGWYIVDGSVAIDAVTQQAITDLVRLPYTKTGRFIRLPNGDFIEVERRVRQLLQRLENVAELSARSASTELKLPEAAIDTVRSLLELDTGIVTDASASEWLAHVDRTLKHEPEVPAELHATLRPYQVEGYRWLQRYSQLGFGVCLADDMGLGKTLQVIALLLTRAANGPALVVAPTSVCSNWIDELTRFAPRLRCAEYMGRGRNALLERCRAAATAERLDVLVVSYSLLQQDADALTELEWNSVVLDEAQFIKNPHSRRARAAFRLKSRYRIVMTGTPVENHLGDLWSLFHFLNPPLLGSLKHFQLRYTRPIERDHDSEQQVALKRLIQPFILRRLKAEVLSELPPVTTLRHEIRLNPDEAMRYALLRKTVHERLYMPAVRRESKLEILAEITRLRRFCCHPRLVYPEAPTESSKLQAFFDLVDEMRENGHRALVFSQFVDFLELVREQLDERAVSYRYLDGSTPKATRQVRVREFQAGQGDLFLISLKAGGFGLNLTGADYVIHLDPWWNPAVEAQASDRAHRIGQTRPVTIYRLVTKDSIEERILSLHREKRAIADALLDGANVANLLSADELMALLDDDACG
jgi:hypothetical protein